MGYSNETFNKLITILKFNFITFSQINGRIKKKNRLYIRTTLKCSYKSNVVLLGLPKQVVHCLVNLGTHRSNSLEENCLNCNKYKYKCSNLEIYHTSI